MAQNQPGSGEPPDLDLGRPPEDDPKAQAQYFLDMLEAFAQHGTQEAKRLRIALIEAIDTYSEQAKEDRDAAIGILKAKILGFEVALSELLLKSTTKIRDKLRLQTRKLGTNTPQGQAIRAGAEGMELVVEAMATMLKAAAKGDQALREKAHALMAEAREKLGPLRGE